MKKKRKTLSKKIRFEVFKRDNFTCQYCGKTPPSITLEIDHINPKSRKGNDDINNLVTSCFDCNRGKKNIPLKTVPSSLRDNIDVLKEKEMQLKEYNSFIQKIEKRLLRNAKKINEIYTNRYPDRELADHFINHTVKIFLKKLPLHEVKEAMSYACSLPYLNKDSTPKYFCGICWNKIKKNEDPLYSTKKRLEKYWANQARGSGYLKEGILEKWLNKHSEEQIKEAMDSARGYWRELEDLLNEEIH